MLQILKNRHKTSGNLPARQVSQLPHKDRQVMCGPRCPATGNLFDSRYEMCFVGCARPDDKARITNITTRGKSMNLHKIAGILGVLVAVIGAFVAVPYGAFILLVLGLVVGYGVLAEHNVRVIVSAIALTMFAVSLESVPAVGSYLNKIVAAVGQVAAGAALFIIFNNMYQRFLGK
jgi:hypothetical protein